MKILDDVEFNRYLELHPYKYEFKVRCYNDRVIVRICDYIRVYEDGVELDRGLDLEKRIDIAAKGLLERYKNHVNRLIRFEIEGKNLTEYLHKKYVQN
jgi:hypothetical protein